MDQQLSRNQHSNPHSVIFHFINYFTLVTKFKMSTMKRTPQIKSSYKIKDKL